MADVLTSDYIADADITDKVVLGFLTVDDDRLETWCEEVDSEIRNMAEAAGVDKDDIDDPPHNMIVKYAVACFCLYVCRDNIGSNNVDTMQDEKYRVKYDIYNGICNSLKGQLSKGMFHDSDGDGELEASDYAGGFLPMFRI